MNILDDKDPLDVFCEASDILNRAVEHTLGPNGTNSAIHNKNGMYEIINDGKAILETITSLDPAVAPALETLKQSSYETNRKAGDGTSSTVVIMNKLLQGARDYLQSNDISKAELRKRLDQIKDEMILDLDKIKQEVKEEDYEKIATVALGDPKYSPMISDVYKFLGSGKRPTLLKSDIPNIEVEKLDGISLNKIKIASSLFINTEEHRELDVVCLFEPVDRFQQMTQFLRKVQSNPMGNTTILFYNQLSTDILENLLFNYANGAIKLIPISLNGYGKGTYKVMEEISNYCDCSIIDNTNIKISDVNKIQFGHIDYATLNSEQAIIKVNDKEADLDILDDKSVIIRVGATNVVEREEIYRRIEDAINSLGNAIDFGIVPGAGYTYNKLILDILDKVDFTIPEFVIKAMSCIREKLGSMYNENVFDSATVIKEVITNAFTVVGQVITTEVLIHDNIR
jgi:chaperonin GroEL